MTYIEITGALIGLLYLWLELRASIWLWPVGIVMPALYIYIFYVSGFYADMGINVYFLGAGIYGWTLWLWKGRRRKQANGQAAADTPGAAGEHPLPISRTPGRTWWMMSATFAFFFVALVFVLKRYTDSTVPWGDSFITALSVVGLWMLSRKYVEQWLVWIVVDSVSAALYWYKGLYPTCALYAIYSVIAVFGYFKWIRMMNAQNAIDNTRNALETAQTEPVTYETP